MVLTMWKENSGIIEKMKLLTARLRVPLSQVGYVQAAHTGGGEGEIAGWPEGFFY